MNGFYWESNWQEAMKVPCYCQIGQYMTGIG
jgi:hypothetical protein